MSESPIRGAVVPPRDDLTPESFDRAHGMDAKSELLWQLSREAYGADYPNEVEPWGMTTWWTLRGYLNT
jgi:hypothetical protein